MASDVEIANRALQKLGAKRIISLADDSVNARACNVAFQPVKLAELRTHRWRFAIKRAALAADAVAPEWGKNNSFTLPSDFILLAPPYPEEDNNARDWEIENGRILTNDSAPLYIRYIFNVTDPNQMDPLFREAFSSRLASELCEEITQSNTKKESLKDDYKQNILVAKRSNCIEMIPEEAPDSTWVTARFNTGTNNTIKGF